MKNENEQRFCYDLLVWFRFILFYFQGFRGWHTLITLSISSLHRALCSQAAQIHTTCGEWRK